MQLQPFLFFQHSHKQKFKLKQHPKNPFYKTTDVEKVSDLVKGQWNYLKLEDDSTVGKMSARLQDSDNKENTLLFSLNLKITK